MHILLLTHSKITKRQFQINLSIFFEKISNEFFVIAGPCVIENEKMTFLLAENLKEICNKYKINFIFKASFDKANRTSIDSFRGLGIDEGLRILEKVKTTFEIPVTTDIHEPEQAKLVSEVADILQIPAFLCRQTDLLLAAGKTDKIINIKKGQFLSGKEMFFPAEKVKSTGNEKILLTERGNFYGYNDLVVDFRNIIDMKELGFPVVLDCSHSSQRPGFLNGKSGGDSSLTGYFAKAGVGVGVNGLFFEVHPKPKNALSDVETQINAEEFEKILLQIKKIHNLEFVN